jgi:hypothetical protein
VEYSSPDENHLVYYGGCNKNGNSLDDMFFYDLRQSKFLEIENDKGIGGRSFHSAVMFGGRMYVFGGRANGYRSDLWSFSFSRRHWSLVKPKSNIAPTARYGHTATIYGGAMARYIISDVKIFNT